MSSTSPTVYGFIFHADYIWSPDEATDYNIYEDTNWIVVLIVATCNHSLNFFLCVLSGKQFRNQFLIIMGCRKKENAGQSGTPTVSSISSNRL